MWVYFFASSVELLNVLCSYIATLSYKFQPKGVIIWITVTRQQSLMNTSHTTNTGGMYIVYITSHAWQGSYITVAVSFCMKLLNITTSGYNIVCSKYFLQVFK